VGDQTLEVRFPRLFGISVQKDFFVCDVGGWEFGEWRWNLVWRRNFFVWEEQLLQDLLNLLAVARMSNMDDRWIWNPGSEDVFSVKSAYVFLDSLCYPRPPLSSLESFVFKFIWKCGAPSKVSALSWQVVLDRVPKRSNLWRRGVIRMEDSGCPLCNNAMETTSHLFLHCRVTANIWYAIMRWFGVVVVIPPTVAISYAMLVGCGSNRKRRKCLSIVWLAFVWVVWKIRNDRVFNNITVDGLAAVDLIQRLSYRGNGL
jgi:hypothetical protein